VRIKKMKKAISVICIVVMASSFLLVACGGEPSSSDTAPTAPTAPIALISGEMRTAETLAGDPSYCKGSFDANGTTIHVEFVQPKGLITPRDCSHSSGASGAITKTQKTPEVKGNVVVEFTPG
jgi:hypothetical protein